MHRIYSHDNSSKEFWYSCFWSKYHSVTILILWYYWKHKISSFIFISGISFFIISSVYRIILISLWYLFQLITLNNWSFVVSIFLSWVLLFSRSYIAILHPLFILLGYAPKWRIFRQYLHFTRMTSCYVLQYLIKLLKDQNVLLIMKGEGQGVCHTTCGWSKPMIHTEREVSVCVDVSSRESHTGGVESLSRIFLCFFQITIEMYCNIPLHRELFGIMCTSLTFPLTYARIITLLNMLHLINYSHSKNILCI